MFRFPFRIQQVDAFKVKGNRNQAPVNFAEDSVLPKVVAAVSFVSVKPDGAAVIADLEDAKAAFYEQAGTIIRS